MIAPTLHMFLRIFTDGIFDSPNVHEVVFCLIDFHRGCHNANSPSMNLLKNSLHLKRTVITVRNEVAKVMFLHLSVILSTGGVCLSACWDTPPGATPRKHTPGNTPPRSTPPGSTHNPPPEKAAAADGTHPAGMHSCSLTFLGVRMVLNHISSWIFLGLEYN